MSPIYCHECNCGHKFDSIRRFNECGIEQPCPKCGRMAKQIIAPMGREPWQPFYCETQNRYFDTRESYQKYCKKKGLEGITASELREVKQEARYLKERDDVKMREIEG